MGSPQVPWDHVPRAQPEIIAIGLYRLGDTDNSVTRVRCWELNSKVTSSRCLIATKRQHNYTASIQMPLAVVINQCTVCCDCSC